MQPWVFKYLDETCKVYQHDNLYAHLSYNGGEFFDSCINLFKELKLIFNVDNEESIRLIIVWGLLKNIYFDVTNCTENIQYQVNLERQYEEMTQEIAFKIDKKIIGRMLELSRITQQVGHNIEGIDDDKID